MLPLMGPLPAPDGLGEADIAVPRGDHHAVLYGQLPADQRQAWRCARLDARDADFRHAGANLAANTLATLQIEDMRPRAIQAPYPRLRTLLDALHGMKPVASEPGGFRFADPATGREVWLSDIP
jgi:hypothetical protein